MVIVGFGHQTQQGKDVSISAIMERFGSKALMVKYSFGDLVRQKVGPHIASLPDDAKMFCDGVLPEGWDTKSELSGLHYRMVLQYCGSKMRSIEPMYWIRKIASAVAGDRPDVAFISGVRFPNEVGWVRSRGGVYVKVERVGYTPNPKVALDITETALNNEEPDYTISANDGDVDALRKSAVLWFVRYFSNSPGGQVSTDQLWEAIRRFDESQRCNK